MTISAQRFKFLDNETNLPIKDFIEISDNSIYNVQEIAETALSGLYDKAKIIEILKNNLNELTYMLENDNVLEEIKNSLNSAIESISKMELPSVIKDMFNSLKNLDSEGVRDFLKDALKAGNNVLCNRINFLKNFSLGIHLNPNILAGLIIALLISWLDRFCSEYSKNERKNMNTREIINSMFPNKALSVNKDSVFEKFTNLYSDFLKSSIPINLQVAISTDEFINNITSGNIDNTLLNLRESEISDSDRDNYLKVLEDELSMYPPGSKEFNNILKARGDLLNMPLLSTKRIDNSIRFSSLSDKLGSYLKQLPDIDIDILSANTLSDIEQSLFNKMRELKSNLSSNSIIRSKSERSFHDFDFNSVLPPLSNQEKNFLINLNYKPESHRDGDIHPTTEAFYT